MVYGADTKQIRQKYYILASDGGRWINRDTTTNQEWSGTREERIEKRGKGGGAGVGYQCAASAGGGREVAM